MMCFLVVIQDCSINPNVLPVTWLSFEVHQENKIVNLEWINTHEFNNAGFEVERSADGVISLAVGNVSSGRDLDDINIYTYNDKAPLTGINYYRIKQIDYDERLIIRKSDRSCSTTKMQMVVVWPNPALEKLDH